MTALGRRHALMRSLRGKIPGDGRKTFRRRTRKAPADMPDYRVAILLPAAWLAAEGRTGVAGVTIEPDPISGPLLVGTGKGIEWVLRQMAKVLLQLSAADAIDRILTGVAIRGDEPASSRPVAIDAKGVSFTMRAGKTITVPR